MITKRSAAPCEEELDGIHAEIKVVEREIAEQKRKLEKLHHRARLVHGLVCQARALEQRRALS